MISSSGFSLLSRPFGRGCFLSFSYGYFLGFKILDLSSSDSHRSLYRIYAAGIILPACEKNMLQYFLFIPSNLESLCSDFLYHTTLSSSHVHCNNFFTSSNFSCGANTALNSSSLTHLSIFVSIYDFGIFAASFAICFILTTSPSVNDFQAGYLCKSERIASLLRHTLK